MRYEQSSSAKLGITFIHVTHSQDEALAVRHAVIVMNDGKIEQIDRPAEIFNRPKNEFVAKFVGNHNIIQLSEKICSSHGQNDFEIAKPKALRQRLSVKSEFQGEKTKVSAVYQDNQKYNA